MDQHTSGAQRAAGVDATVEQRAAWDWRLRQRAAVAIADLDVLATAAASHPACGAEDLADGARAAASTLKRALQRAEDRKRCDQVRGPWGSPVLLGERPEPDDLVNGRGDQPPFAPEFVVDLPPHER